MKRLRRIRAEKGLTMDALEERTGVSKRTISEIERGLRAPQVLTLAKLAEALGVRLDDLVEEEAQKAPAPRASGAVADSGEKPPRVTVDLEPLTMGAGLGPITVEVGELKRVLRLVEAGQITTDDAIRELTSSAA